MEVQEKEQLYKERPSSIQTLLLVECNPNLWSHKSYTFPFFRFAEESEVLEGLMTAALGQLGNIVCRVVYCPGWHDPISILQPSLVKKFDTHVTKYTSEMATYHAQPRRCWTMLFRLFKYVVRKV